MATTSVCAACSQLIDGRAVDALQQKWHSNCFVCDFCKQVLVSQYVGKYGRPYCAPCERRLFGNYCEECNQPIVGQIISALGKFYHPSHLLCSRCKISVQAGYVEHSGRPFCKDCLAKLPTGQ